MDHPLESLNSGITSSIFIHVIFEQQTQKSLNPKSTCRQAKPKADCKHTAAVSVEVPRFPLESVKSQILAIQIRRS
uniref:Uncharacterized protein n=1 Tax=Vespula pensylvanica TaxID=30213 RepID=A0A834KCN8_VESPE|nr:hypothetical protein H0235_014952 [Vespula pensylvanica]